MTCLLGLDIGTTGTKAFLYSLQGEILSSDYRSYTLYHTKPDWSELEPKEVWSTIIEVTRKCIEVSGIDPDEILALSISALGHAIMPVDKDSNPLFRCIQIYDNRSVKEGKDLQQRLGQRIYEITDNRYIINYPVAKILWIRNHVPEVYEKTDKFIGWHEFVTWKLCGEPVVDYSLAECIGLFDIEKRRWSRELLDEIGLDEDLMPRAEIAGTSIGDACTKDAERMGLSKKTEVVVGAHDVDVSAIGAGAIKPGIWMDLTGTFELIRAPLPEKGEARRLTCGGVRNSKDIPFLGGGIATAGAVFRWFRDNFGYEEQVEGHQEGIDPYDLLTQRAAKANLGSDGLIFLPEFRNARGTFIGITLKHEKNEFVRATLEGLTFELRHIFDLLEEKGLEAREIRAIGGGAKSEFWLQLKADITKKNIVKPRIIEGGSLGAAILAGIGVDIYSDVENGVELTYQTEAVYRPDEMRSEKYDSHYGRYITIRSEMNDVYDRIASRG